MTSRRLQPGETIPALHLRTATGRAQAVPAPDASFTHLQFRRFAGCPICNLHLHRYAGRVRELERAGIRPVVFFHSPAAELRPHHEQLPFAVIPDGAKRYYRQFGIESSVLGSLHPRAMWSGLRGLLRGHFRPQMTGGPFSLPADFLVDADGVLLAVHYGRHADDHWEVDDLLRFTASRQPGRALEPLAFSS